MPVFPVSESLKFLLLNEQIKMIFIWLCNETEVQSFPYLKAWSVLKNSSNFHSFWKKTYYEEFTS